MDIELRQHLLEILQVYKRRLRSLEKQDALLGPQSPPHVTMEIQDLNDKILEIVQQLEEHIVEKQIDKPSGEHKETFKTIIVDPMGREGYHSVAKAVESAKPGDQILIRPGVYNEHLIIDKPLEIIGSGEIDETVLQYQNISVVLIRTSFARITNLSIRQVGKLEGCSIDVIDGRVEIVACDISSQAWGCINIHNNATAVIKESYIHDSKQNGVRIFENGKGLIENCSVYGNGFANVEVEGNGALIARHNKIYNGIQGGIFIKQNSQATVDSNEIYNNGYAGVEIKSNNGVMVFRNRIYDGFQGGILIQEGGTGKIEENDIFNNGYAGIEIKSGANPDVKNNRIHGGIREGIHVHAGGRGKIEDNDIFNNLYSGIEIKTGGDPLIKKIEYLGIRKTE
jgi:F-box protein 11